MHWRSKWQPTPVFLPGDSQGRQSLVGYHLWGRTESDTTEVISLFTFMHWRSKWQPTPAFLPGDSQGQRSLLGCREWGGTESNATEATEQQQQQQGSYSSSHFTPLPLAGDSVQKQLSK